MADSYEKRARAKRKQLKKREKAEQKRAKKDQEPDEGESEQDIAARYLDLPDEDDE